MKTIRCDHCGQPFESEHYGPETCPPCKKNGCYDGKSTYCRVCIARKSTKQGDE